MNKLKSVDLGTVAQVLSIVGAIIGVVSSKVDNKLTEKHEAELIEKIAKAVADKKGAS